MTSSNHVKLIKYTHIVEIYLLYVWFSKILLSFIWWYKLLVIQKTTFSKHDDILNIIQCSYFCILFTCVFNTLGDIISILKITFCIIFMYWYIISGFESQFDKKAFGTEMEQSELEAFFRECDLYPSHTEIEEGLDVTTKGTYSYSSLQTCYNDVPNKTYISSFSNYQIIDCYMWESTCLNYYISKVFWDYYLFLIVM